MQKVVGFESHHPLLEKPWQRGFFVDCDLNGQATKPPFVVSLW
jgi:hypothetical protein